MVFLYILLAWSLMAAIGLALTYRDPNSPFYQRLTLATILMGFLTAPGCFLDGLWQLKPFKHLKLDTDKVIFGGKKK